MKKRLLIAAVIAVLVAAVAIGLYEWNRKYTVKNIQVEGNFHYTSEEIAEMVTKGPLGKNSVYLSLKYRKKGIRNVPFIDVMDVEILSPDTIQVTVYEKALAGYIRYLDSCIYFDKDGYVVECSGIVTPGIPQVAGLRFGHAVLGQKLPVEDQDVFERIMNLTKLLGKYELNADKIFFHGQGEVTIYFQNVKAALGNDDSYLEDKMKVLPDLLERLQGQSGTLRMEKFTEDHSNAVFQPDGQ